MLGHIYHNIANEIDKVLRCSFYLFIFSLLLSKRFKPMCFINKNNVYMVCP